MKIYLRDRSQELVNAWTEEFQNFPDIVPSCGDIFEEGPWLDVDAIVSPANSFGFMNGGIDFVYSEYFGLGAVNKLQEYLWEEHQGELLVGQAVVIDMRNTSNQPDQKARAERIPYLISAPTMRVPMNVSQTVNAFLAFRAALRAAQKHNFNAILCPGLGTAIGQMPHKICAKQMVEAYKFLANPPCFDMLWAASNFHTNLLK